MPSRDELAEAKYIQQVERRARGILRWMSIYMEEGDMGGLKVSEITVLAPNENRSDYLVRIKAADESGRKFVAFKGASSVEEALNAIKTQAEVEGLRWKDDKPFPAPAETPAQRKLRQRLEEAT